MNIWKSGIWGVVIGDALGAPVEFVSRGELSKNPVKGMLDDDSFPAGTWTDDSSLTLATLSSIVVCKGISLSNIANNFMGWLNRGDFTPYGFTIGMGHVTRDAILHYEVSKNVYTCGLQRASDNGNGSLMRIMPAVLYCIQKKLPVDKAIAIIHDVSALTHAHSRSKIACGLYYFMALSVINESGPLLDRLQIGLDMGFAYYKTLLDVNAELDHFDRLRDLGTFKDAEDIRTSGYVVDTIEAAVWGLITTASFDEALLKLVNMGGDTDTIAAVAGGLAGLYYGYDAIPGKWLDVIQRKAWIDSLIDDASVI